MNQSRLQQNGQSLGVISLEDGLAVVWAPAVLAEPGNVTSVNDDKHYMIYNYF